MIRSWEDSMGSDREANSRAEYAARINRVVDHVEKHLDEPLALEDLAKVACFSPFHFHRLFKAFTGESLYQFVLRLRLEKAASQLVQHPNKSVTAIALDCGFGSSASFARSFRAAFGMSASQWRDGGSKNCKTVRKGGKEGEGSSGYGAPDAGAWGAGHTPGSGGMQKALKVKDPQSVEVVNQAAMTVAYVRHTGPYAGDAALFGRLFGQIMKWAGPRGLLGPATKCLTIYHDNPEITEEDKRRISVCVAVPQGTRAEGEIGVMEIPAGKYVMARFEIDPSEYGEAWAYVYGKWLPESGYQPDDRPCFELYLNDPEKHPQKKHVVAICAPVRPL
ncbi:MAG: AraC family transcriptional regulator [Myxococcales bacterium]